MVVQKFVLQLEAQLADRHVTIEATDDAIDWLAKNGFDELYGARPLARVIQEEIKKPLADDILFGTPLQGRPRQGGAEGRQAGLRVRRPGPAPSAGKPPRSPPKRPGAARTGPGGLVTASRPSPSWEGSREAAGGDADARARREARLPHPPSLRPTPRARKERQFHRLAERRRLPATISWRMRSRTAATKAGVNQRGARSSRQSRILGACATKAASSRSSACSAPVSAPTTRSVMAISPPSAAPPATLSSS